MNGLSPVALALTIVMGYLIGAIPFGLLAGRLFKGVDVRQYGSGKIGSANVARSLGARMGMLVMVLDIGKGMAAVFVGQMLNESATGGVFAGIAAVVGHNWSVFIGFAGGRGVSTGVGGLFALAPVAGLAAAVAAFSTMGASRYVSLGSMFGAVVGAIALAGLVIFVDGYTWQYLVYAAVVAPLIIFQHRDNIGRLLRGEERRLGQKAQPRMPTSDLG